MVAPNTSRKIAAAHFVVRAKVESSNARQIPELSNRAFELKTAQLPDEIPDELPELDTLETSGQFDAVSSWAELWRIEKDGKQNYRWRLRFDPGRRSQPGGKLTPDIKKKLKKRPGKGRHFKSREEAQRLRSRAKHLAERIRSSDSGGDASAVV